MRNLPNQLEEEAVAKALERIRSLAAELEQAGVPKTRYYRGTTKQYGWWTRSQGTAAMLRADAFGRYKTVENPAGHKYGWPVGVCPWSGTKTTPGMYGGGTTEVITVRMMTFVMTDGKVVNGDDPSAGTEYQTSRLRPEGQLSSLLNEIADRLAKHRPA